MQDSEKNYKVIWQFFPSIEFSADAPFLIFRLESAVLILEQPAPGTAVEITPLPGVTTSFLS
jgi:hypothetical protein